MPTIGAIQSMGKVVSMDKEERSAFKQQVKADVEAARAEKKRIRSLKGGEKREAKAALKEAQAVRKAEVAAMDGDERKLAKRHDRMVNRRVHWLRTTFACVAAVLVMTVAAAGVAVHMLVGSLLVRALMAGFNTTTPEAVAAQDESRQAVVSIEEEGIVLLENDGILPLSAPMRLNVFGRGSVASVFGGGGSGSADTSHAVTLQQGLENAGFEVNPTLVNLYTNWANSGVVSTEDAGAVDTSQARGLEQTMGTTFSANELDPAQIDASVIDKAVAFSDTALIVVSRTGSEGSDLPYEYLQLSQEERELVNLVCSRFDHVVVLVNTAATMELGWVEEYPQIEAVAWIGPVGNTGMEAVGRMLSGAVNPSGRLVDTYAYNLMDNPANLMIANPKWLANEYHYDGLDNAFFINYYEGIYVGYRYFETAAADGHIDYDTTVQYPFGYGLSYTTFNRELLGVESDGTTVTMQVRVTNTGNVAGKDVVEAYYSAPWNAKSGIEKSAVELAAFQKTEELAPGASQTVELSWGVRDMASFDPARGAYVLEAGTYAISLRSDSHTVIASEDVQIAEDVVYATDEVTGNAIEQRFADAAGDLVYLSRADWAGTWPDPDAASCTPSDLAVANYKYELPASGDVEYPVTGAKNGIVLSDLAGLAYDDPRWDAFLDQLTVKEMAKQVSGGGYGTEGLDRLGVPSKKDMDGPAAINNVWAGTSGVQFPAEVVIGSTWNTELAALTGDRIATEARIYDVVGWYAPGANLHRSAFGGRNFEYFSEDPLLSGKMAASEIDAAQKLGVVCYLKHFALNEQENNRNNNGLYTWANEQAIRELYLGAFEVAVKDGAPLGIMSSFNRVGSVWAGGTSALLTDVLRDEWGFHGVVVSDATNMVFWPYMNQAQGVLAGNDLFLDYGANYDSMVLAGQAKGNAELQQAMRVACHNILYSVANSAAVGE